MQIQADSLTFKYQNILKTQYKKGRLPSVKYGFYGDRLTKKTVTLEHLRPVCQGGKTELKNLVLASANKNQERGIRPLAEVLNWKNVWRYLDQFKNVIAGDFNGNDYIKMILNTIKELLNG